MELHLTPDEATDEEKAAVDGLLAAPKNQWSGAQRNSNQDGGGSSAPANARHQLLPVLHSLQSHIGWLSPGALNYVAVRLDIPPAEVYSVASFYDLFRLEPSPAKTLHVCDDIACKVQGADALCRELETRFGIEGSSKPGADTTWRRSPCLGLCDRAPAALLMTAGKTPTEKALANVDGKSLASAMQGASTNGASPHARPDPKSSLPQFGQPQLRLLRRVGNVDPGSVDDFLNSGGYDALKRALSVGPESLVQEVIDSRLLGRGGAAFPTGKKWEALLRQRKPGAVHYVVCNADESEPGTFKDRIVMEGDPFAVLEGLTIAAFATGAQKGFLYIRGEYPEALGALTRAIDAARAAHFLGERILGSDFSFDIAIRRGAGAYICGEETALFNSIEGYRGEPRNKPPFPTQSGLFRQPTVVNNVETLLNIPEIVLHGGAAYARIGTAQSAGHRLFCLSGHVVRPGLYEIPFGMTLRQLLELAGGVGGNGRLQGILLGGAAGSFVSPGELDTPLTFEGVRAIGASLGSGVIMPFDDSVDLKQILARIASFFRHESCGQCVPCRVGTIRQEEILKKMADPTPRASRANDFALLKEVAQAMRDASICGLGQTAPTAILSALERWSLYP